MSEIDELRCIIEDSENLVFFGGAGVSTDSGIPDFRGCGGVYDGDYGDSESALTREVFIEQPEIFFDYFRRNIYYPDALPNCAHNALALLEREGKLSTIVTQNIDGLHQKAGSENVLELHGSALRFYCVACGKECDAQTAMTGQRIPRCSACGAIVRPDIVLYGESVNGDILSQAEETVNLADVLLVAGTSLSVYSAAAVMDCYEGEHLIIINDTPTAYDGLAELLIREPIGDVFSQLVE